MKHGAAFLSAAATLLTLSLPAFAAQKDQKDSGREFELLFLDAEVGPQYVGLQTLKTSKCGTTNVDCGLVDDARVKTKDLGMMYGAGLGVQLPAFRFGARFRYGNFADWQLWTLGAEAGMRFPFKKLEPYFTLGAGYASLGGVHSDLAPVDINGLNLRGSAGLDYYLSNTFSLGANLSCDVLFLGRKGDGETRQLTTDPNRRSKDWVYSVDGSGTGLGGTLSLVLGLHW